ncbi:putative catalytic domain of family 2 polysaccharide deacetylases [Candidatus Termititenax dinenymphae]|uniref:Catalytic domain of family 2 polysaccharide deacetylases n=1 Tax=Candidatus Termititenax dinenymphae TaxID=2218523 RepID=A0A388TJQ7_9BACT|nr:putative catalytic domain of family 2 polysaccharide deacetylases [Candidatus Termititenax dinenymphae]
MKKILPLLCLLALLQAKPKMAIVVDDCGYSPESVKTFTAIKYPLTMAVIPGLAYSKSCAETISAAKKQLLIHFPWTPLGNNGRQSYPIRIERSYTPARITAMLVKAAESVPNANGINNHQGSILSADSVMMDRVMSVVQVSGQKYYFLDSNTTVNSKAERTAKKHGIPSTHNDVFLDGTQTDEYIEKRFAYAVSLAKQRGTVVAICHDRPATRRVLRKLMIQYNDQVDFVFLPEIMANRNKH